MGQRQATKSGAHGISAESGLRRTTPGRRQSRTAWPTGRRHAEQRRDEHVRSDSGRDRAPQAEGRRSQGRGARQAHGTRDAGWS